MSMKTYSLLLLALDMAQNDIRQHPINTIATQNDINDVSQKTIAPNAILTDI